ncbi:MAG: BON domain-containing protein [Stenotrophomonas sp.]
MKTDSELQKEIVAELEWEPSVNAAGIGVEVKDGIVTLAGHVDSYAEKVAAEKAAARVNGVKAIAVEMDVRLVISSQRYDADIAKSAINALEWSTLVPDGSVNVMVEGGWITLTGVVTWAFQRSAANIAVRHLVGVKGITDGIKIKPKVSSSDLKADIQAALNRRARNEGSNITISVSDHDVTLSGTAESWAERELVSETAWRAPGVWNVIDNVQIE